jgi:hypothetical protein
MHGVCKMTANGKRIGAVAEIELQKRSFVKMLNRINPVEHLFINRHIANALLATVSFF